MVLVMVWERQYFVGSLASLPVNTLDLRHVTDKLAPIHIFWSWAII